MNVAPPAPGDDQDEIGRILGLLRAMTGGGERVGAGGASSNERMVLV